ncbi:MAG: hypothetical protein A2297_00920 [Elusimicrobia bacterium RIFOXYB2_FULL_48_7]|nr:MAG: hypothetical protein A2297_00920 [Elusimicrobia bacterium RIFOXYB2_FULL_48_7]
MEKFKKYKHGRRIYTQLDKQTKQITVLSKKHREPEAPASLKLTGIDQETIPAAKFADSFAVGHNREEFYIDCFKSTGEKKTLVSRVILSPKVIKKLQKELSKVIGDGVSLSV